MVRNVILAVVMTVGVLALGATPAYAGSSCKLVPSFCPPAPGGGGAVPEPGTLGVLAAGALAAVAARRRNKK